MTPDRLVVIAVVAAALVAVVRRAWRALRPRPTQDGCAGCGGH